MFGKFLLAATFWLHVTFAKGWWCQAPHGSCVGQRHKFTEAEVATSLEGAEWKEWYAHWWGTFRIADWDADGDMDVLVADYGHIWFFERLPDGEFQKHKLIPEVEASSYERRFEIADWDGDNRLDILLCSVADNNLTVRFLNRSLLVTAGPNELSEDLVILQTAGSACDMRAVDFDEDGDLDLIMGKEPQEYVYRPRFQKYFERISDDLDALEERAGKQNPLEVFGGQVQDIADLDGDGRLDVIATNHEDDLGAFFGMAVRWRYFRRTAAGTFSEPQDNPLGEIQFGRASVSKEVHVVDWNSDGLPDVIFLEVEDSGGWNVRSYLHVVDRDLRRNTHFDAYKEIQKFKDFSFSTVDWNGDDFEDVVVLQYNEDIGHLELRLYEFQFTAMKEVVGVFDNVSLIGSKVGMSIPALVDWDQDGDLDLLISSAVDGQIHYHEMISGNLQKEASEHPFKNVDLYSLVDQWMFKKGFVSRPIVVDWDNDGDLDLFLSPPDGRYFEQLADGSLREWPVGQSPLVRALSSHWFTKKTVFYYVSWQFVDCDADGDLDLLRIPGVEDVPVVTCEHHNETHEFECPADLLCLGTNLSHYQGGATEFKNSFFVVNGQLNFLMQPYIDILYSDDHYPIELWTPGFCLPTDACHEKGLCSHGQTHCSCIAGHDAADCSSCQPHYHGVRFQELQMPDCKACPGDSQVCYGRGSCFDDVVAKRLEESTAALMALGNGSCSCNENHFSGTDDEGRKTCMDGHCPAGTEEKAGLCTPCPGGFFSTEGGSSSCSLCDAGRFAKDSLTCEQCPAGTYASIGSNRCLNCHEGHVSVPGSATCRSCGGLLVRASPDAMNQTCQLDTVDILVGLICWVSGATFCFLFVTCLSGNLPISDISSQGEKLVITTAMVHYILKRAQPAVSFAGTGVPALDSMVWRVEALSLYQLTLHGEAKMPLDTSTGHLRLAFRHRFLSMGLWRCPAILWCLFFLAAAAGTAVPLTWSLRLVVWGLGVSTGVLAFALRRRRGATGCHDFGLESNAQFPHNNIAHTLTSPYIKLPYFTLPYKPYIALQA
eukprot:Skav204519  [mRNA]  locus=scaffold3201:315296:320710:+ [translate_table: standard]